MKRKFRVRTLIFIIVMIMVLSLGVGGFYLYKFYQIKDYKSLGKKLRTEIIVATITNNYGSNVKTIKDADLYCLEGKDYKPCGKVREGEYLTLDEVSISEKSLYFPVGNLANQYFVFYKDVRPVEEIPETEKRFKRYVPFNKNIKTTEGIKLYKDENIVYELPENIDLPIYIIDGDKYYVAYQDELYYLIKDDTMEVYDHSNTNERRAGSITTFLYHFIYDPSSGDKCNDSICHKYQEVEAQLKYLNENGYFAISLEEFELWIDYKLNLPAKTVVLTVDDGGFGANARRIFNQYKVMANLFLITAWFNADEFESEYFRVYSHTHNMHANWACPKSGYAGSYSQGGALLCMSEADIQADLTTSRQRSYNRTALSYPFYDYNDYTIAQAKKAGFTMGFGGRWAGGHYNMERGSDKMKIPRYTFMTGSTTVNQMKTILASNYSI